MLRIYPLLSLVADSRGFVADSLERIGARMRPSTRRSGQLTYRGQGFCKGRVEIRSYRSELGGPQVLAWKIGIYPTLGHEDCLGNSRRHHHIRRYRALTV